MQIHPAQGNHSRVGKGVSKATKKWKKTNQNKIGNEKRQINLETRQTPNEPGIHLEQN